MSSAFERRLAEIEAALERLTADRQHGDDLVTRDPATLTDLEAADAWRRLCQRPPMASDSRPMSDAERAAILAAWREMTG
jgi:hypothetical protein